MYTSTDLHTLPPDGGYLRKVVMAKFESTRKVMPLTDKKIITAYFVLFKPWRNSRLILKQNDTPVFEPTDLPLEMDIVADQDQFCKEMYY